MHYPRNFLYGKMVAGREQLLGEENVYMLEGVYILAVILGKKGQDEDALALFEKAYVGTKTLVGAEHPDTKELQGG
jgi:hypothetical protein